MNQTILCLLLNMATAGSSPMPHDMLAGTAHDIIPIPDNEVVYFLGFSINEQLAAWHITREYLLPNTNPPQLETYAIMEVRELRSGKMRRFQVSSPTRVSPQAKNVRKRRAVSTYPEFLAAEPVKDWTRLKKRGRFRYHLLPLSRGGLTLNADTDVSLTGRRTRYTLDIASQKSSAVGFGLRLLRQDGTRVDGPDFRFTGTPQAHTLAQVEAFVGPTGRNVALLTTAYTLVANTMRVRAQWHIARLAGVSPIVGTKLLQTEGILGMERSYRKHIGGYGGDMRLLRKPATLRDAHRKYNPGYRSQVNPGSSADDLYRKFVGGFGCRGKPKEECAPFSP